MSVEETVAKLEKQSRTPRNFDSIQKGALALELKDKVALRDCLTAIIEAEIDDMKQKLKEAEEIVNGK